jgi:hypothetical protein
MAITYQEASDLREEFRLLPKLSYRKDMRLHEKSDRMNEIIRTLTEAGHPLNYDEIVRTDYERTGSYTRGDSLD